MNEITSMEAAQPHSVEAEQQVLGALMVNESAWPKVAPILKAEDFFDPVHADIFSAIADRHSKGHPATAVTIKTALENHEGLKDLGGGAYIIRLAGGAIGTKFVADYARLIVERRQARSVIVASEEARQAILEGEDPQEASARLQHTLMALEPAEGRETCVSFMKAGTDALEKTVAAYQGEVSLLTTGIDPLDKILRGLAPSDLMLLGGATSMGKSAVAVDIARRVAERGQVVGFASLEMDPDQLVARVTSSLSRVPYELARAAHEMSEDNMRAWVEATKKSAELPIHVFPRHVRDIAAIQSTAQGLKMRQGRLGLVIVDYAQLCRAPGREFRERMVNVSIGLKHMAKVLECPVIALVQLDRKLGDRPDPRPNTSDIKETSQFETDADQIVMCHREHYYLQRRGPERNKAGEITPEAEADFQADLKRYENQMELIVRKNRHGRLAKAVVGCHMPTNRLWNLHEDHGEF